MADARWRRCRRMLIRLLRALGTALTQLGDNFWHPGRVPTDAAERRSLPDQLPCRFDLPRCVPTVDELARIIAGERATPRGCCRGKGRLG